MRVGGYMDKKNRCSIIFLVIFCCIVMAITEVIIEPTYLIKSIVKIIMFFIIPLSVFNILKIKVFDNFKLNKKEIIRLFGLGIFIYLIIMIAYFITKDIFDYTKLTNSLTVDQKVNSNYYLLVALYISFGNSLLEEFLFRLISFIKLSEFSSKKFSYVFSSCMFSIYHIAMIGKSFPIPLTIICLIGLIVGGVIFNYLDDKNKNIYNSWFIHMFCDFAIMTIWFINM